MADQQPAKAILRKKAFEKKLEEGGLSIEKLPPVRAGFALDISGSTNNDYYNGVYQQVTDRVFPVALALDDNGTMEACTFDNNAYRKPDINMDNHAGYVGRHIYPPGTNFTGGTMYAPPIEMLIDEYFPAMNSIQGAKKLFSGFASRLTGKKTDAELPAVMFICTDGKSFDESKSFELINGLQAKPVFIIFLGIGIHESSDGATYLNRLKNQFRHVDAHLFLNGNFKSDDLYSRIANPKFIKWLGDL